MSADAVGLPERFLQWFTCFCIRKTVCFGKACGLHVLDVVQKCLNIKIIWVVGGGLWVVGWECHIERALGLPEGMLPWFTCFCIRKTGCFGKACGLHFWMLCNNV